MKFAKCAFWIATFVIGTAAAVLCTACDKSGSKSDSEGNGSSATSPAAAATNPTTALVVKGAATFYVCKPGSDILEQVNSNGEVSPFAMLPDNLSPQGGMALDSNGDLCVAACRMDDPFNYKILKITQDATVSVYATPNTHYAPFGMASNTDGDFLVAEQALGSCQISRITEGGFVNTVAALPRGSADSWLAVDSDRGNVYVAGILDAGRLDKIVAVTSDGVPRLFASVTGETMPQGLALDAHGNLYLANSGGGKVGDAWVGNAGNGKIRKINADDHTISTFATLPVGSSPEGLVFDRTGNLFVADAAKKEILKITPAGVVSTFAKGVERAYSIALRDPLSFAPPPAAQEQPTPKNADLVGKWVARDDKGNPTTFTAVVPGALTLEIDDPQFKAAFPGGMPCTYAFHRASPYVELDIQSSGFGMQRSMMRFIYLRISSDKFKLEGFNVGAKRPKSFAPNAPIFSKVASSPKPASH